jgi:hypothetical protein
MYGSKIYVYPQILDLCPSSTCLELDRNNMPAKVLSPYKQVPESKADCKCFSDSIDRPSWLTVTSGLGRAGDP